MDPIHKAFESMTHRNGSRSTFVSGMVDWLVEKGYVQALFFTNLHEIMLEKQFPDWEPPRETTVQQDEESEGDARRQRPHWAPEPGGELIKEMRYRITDKGRTWLAQNTLPPVAASQDASDEMS